MIKAEKFIALLLFFIFFTVLLKAQNNGTATISGFVYDKSNGETLIGTNVYLKNSHLGSITNNNGYFVISNVRLGKQIIVASYVGYTSSEQEIDVTGNGRIIKIYLTPSPYNVGEVVVKGDSAKIGDRLFSRPVSTIEMNSQQVNQIPKVVEADLLRALQSMPGITALSDFSSAIYVRGGTPDQNLYLVDGAEIYNPEHAFGIFSTFNTNAIKRVEVSKGGFGAEYGDRLSSVIDVINLEGNRNKFQGDFNLSLIAASLTLQMPLWSFGSISGSFRRTYIDQTYAKFIKNLPAYYFDDGNIKAFFQLDDKDNLTLSYFGSKDNLDYKIDKTLPESPHFLYDWGNKLGTINWKHIFNDKVFTSFYLTASDFRSNFSLNQLQQFNEKNTLSDYTGKASLEYFISNELNMKTGIDYKHLNLLYNFDWSAGLVNISSLAHETSTYLSFLWHPVPVWDIEAGLRYTSFRTDKTFSNFLPRLSIKYRLSATSNLKFATGIYSQYLDSIQRLFFSSIWMAADKNISDSKATHFILGYQKQVGNYFVLDLETYIKNYKNLYIFNQNFNAQVNPTYYLPGGDPVYTSDQNLLIRGDGKSYGLELMLRKDIGAVTGWVSYSLSRTLYTFDGINQENSFAPRQDRTSVLNFVLNGNISDIFKGNWNGASSGKGTSWLLGLNFVYTSGQPITVPVSAYFVNTLPDWNNYSTANQDLPAYKLYPGAIDTYRLPPYIRMDLSITYHKDYGSWSLSPYLQIINIGNRKNVWFINYKSNLQNGAVVQDITTENMLPILPSLGLTIKF